MKKHSFALEKSYVRVATGADADRLAAIHATAFSVTETWSSAVFGLHLRLPNVTGLLYADDGMILARISGGEAEIITLAVTPAARRRGVASTLLQAAIIQMAASGAVVLFLEVSVKNTAARRLYLGCGFVEVGRRPAYYSDRSDALVLRIDLNPPDETCGPD